MKLKINLKNLIIGSCKTVANSFLIMTLLSCKMIASSNEGKQKVENFYIHKNCKVIEKSLIKFDKDNVKLSHAQTFDYSRFQTVIGTISGVFIKDANCGNRILSVSKDLSNYTKVMILTSLFHAEMNEVAKEFANQNSLNNQFRNLNLKNITDNLGIKNIIPNADSGMNNLLIGAYYATGDDVYLKNLLHNFKTKNKEKVKDAIRVGLVTGKFGFGLSPPGHKSKMLGSLKKKYYTDQNSESLLQFMTMSSAFWALNSIAKDDKNVAEYLNSFFLDGDLKKIFLTEQNHFSNYLTILMLDIVLGKEETEKLTTNNEGENRKFIINKNKKLIADYEEFKELNLKELTNEKN